jgi:MerR family mercuric resistance operon transcriptional regulator
LGNLTIGAFAKSAEVNIETIRFYQRKGLLVEPDRPYGGIRRYGEADVARVKFVKTAQRLGFSLDEVGQLLRLEDGTHCSEAADIAGAHLADVRARLADLKRVNRRSIGTPYRRAKGTPLALHRSIDVGRGFRAAGGVGRA